MTATLASIATLASTALSYAADPTSARAPFTDRRSPPAWRELDESTAQRFELGQLVFNSTWVPAGTPNAGRRDGLGPLFVLGSCDGCHNNGARGRGEPGNRLPNSFVMQLGGPATAYGAVLNTQALPGHIAEGRVVLQWTNREGRYPDGAVWSLREPGYTLTSLGYGELPPEVVLRPRIGSALFGAGLLEAVPERQIESMRRAQPRGVRGQIVWHESEGRRLPGRFGWQADTVSIEDQTARALAREMGLTSEPRPRDDCTESQQTCRDAANGGSPEVSPEFLQAMVVFQRELAVPQRGTPARSGGEALFHRTGCTDCHRPELGAQQAGSGRLRIDAFTDLLVHDMGPRLADRRLDGVPVQSLWRTAPLWGMKHAIANGDVALLHDGRARNVEEAVLWHDGQARMARRAFERLPAPDRQALLEWVESL